MLQCRSFPSWSRSSVLYNVYVYVASFWCSILSILSNRCRDCCRFCEWKQKTKGRRRADTEREEAERECVRIAFLVSFFSRFPTRFSINFRSVETRIRFFSIFPLRDSSTRCAISRRKLRQSKRKIKEHKTTSHKVWREKNIRERSILSSCRTFFVANDIFAFFLFHFNFPWNKVLFCLFLGSLANALIMLFFLSLWRFHPCRRLLSPSFLWSLLRWR